MTTQTIIGSLIVKPEKEPVFSAAATTVSIDDEGGGPFVRIAQDGRESDRRGIAVDSSEWPAIREAVERMIIVVGEQEVT